jgi:nucleotide-binding universal stress UspA family protein
MRNLSVGVDLTSGDRLVAVPEDLAPSCRAAIDRAVWLAKRLGASLHVSTSLDVDGVAEELIRRQHAETGDSLLDAAARVLEALVAAARADGLRITTEVVFGAPARLLAEDARRSGRDLVVVGSRRRGAKSRRRTSLQLLRHCAAPVWIARSGADLGVRCVLAAVDHGHLATQVVDIAATLAAAVGARLHLLHVVEDSSERVIRAGGADDETVEAYRRARRAPADEALRALVSRASAAGVNAVTHVRTGDPAERIVAAANELGADVMVVGTTPHGGLSATIWGSVAEQALMLTDTSLVIVKHEPPSA